VVPQDGRPSDFGLPAAGGDTLYRYNPDTRGYTPFVFDDLDNIWVPQLPVIAVGEAFFYFRVGAATNWVRNFSVNNPT
jgi:hypothetical protein